MSKQIKPENVAIGGRVRKARLAAGLTQAQLARTVGVSNSAVGQWEIGRTPPGRDSLGLASLTLGVTVDWLMTGVDSNDTNAAETMNERMMLVHMRRLPHEAQQTALRLVASLPTPGRPRIRVPAGSRAF